MSEEVAWICNSCKWWDDKTNDLVVVETYIGNPKYLQKDGTPHPGDVGVKLCCPQCLNTITCVKMKG